MPGGWSAAGGPATAPHDAGVLVIDDSGDRKDGTVNAHVGHQWLGRYGKTDNGVVTVTTVWADERLYYPIDAVPHTRRGTSRKGRATRDAGPSWRSARTWRSGSPGWTSPSPPPTARGCPGGCPGTDRRCWAVHEAGKTHARSSRRITATTPRLRTAAAASAPRCPRPARSSGRPATSWPGSATTRSPPSETPHRHGDQPVTAPARPDPPQPHSPDGDHRGQLPTNRCQPLPALPRKARRAA